MKPLRRFLIIVLSLSCSLATVACGNNGSTTNSRRSLSETGIAAIQVSPASLMITGIGTVIEMSLVVSLHNGKVLTGVKSNAVDPISLQSYKVEWSSDNVFVANFDGPGKLRAVSAGQTIVRASVNGVISEAAVTVEAVTSLNPLDVESAISLHVANATINPSDILLENFGEVVALSADLLYSDTVLDSGIKRYYHHPSSTLIGQLVWTSSDPSVVQILGPGIIRAISSGTATISVDDPWAASFPEDEIVVTVDIIEGGEPDPDPDPDPEVMEESLPEGADAYVDSIYSFTKGTNGGFNEGMLPGIVLGAPKGAGSDAGSTDVLSLGVGGEIILEFTDFIIFDGEGDDFIIFENAFEIGGDPSDVFSEPATVSVSDDGLTWYNYSCDLGTSPYVGCAGTKPTLANPDNNVIDPTDPAVAGGNAFDLAESGLLTARYVKIADSGLGIGPIGPSTGGFDLDAASIVHGTSP